MQHTMTLFKTNLWKLRSLKRKAWKIEHNITKLDFTHYRQRHLPSRDLTSDDLDSSDTEPPRRRRTPLPFNYTNPQNDFRNYKTDLDYLFFLFSSSNFLHSGSFLIT